MASRLVLTIMDHGFERSTVSFQGVSIGGANYDAQVALHNELISAIQDITIGTINKRMTVAAEAVLTSSAPTSPFAQRENKWLVRYHDVVTGDRFTLSIPCADLSLLEPNGERLDASLPAGQYDAFKDAFEAYVKVGEVVDNAVEVDEILFVARNI